MFAQCCDTCLSSLNAWKPKGWEGVKAPRSAADFKPILRCVHRQNIHVSAYDCKQTQALSKSVPLKGNALEINVRPSLCTATKASKQAWRQLKGSQCCVAHKAQNSLAIALCDPVGVLGEWTPNSVTSRLPGKVQVVIIKGLKHVLLDENISAITKEGFASMLNLGEEGSGYIETQGDSMWH